MDKKTSKVYVPNRGSGHDYSSAEEYGSLVFVTSGAVNPYNTGAIYRKWYDALKDSSPQDYIVSTSLNVLCMIGAGMFAAKHGRLNILLFTKSGTYKKREIVYDKVS